MTDSLFEVITKEEFEGSGADVRPVEPSGMGIAVGGETGGESRIRDSLYHSDNLIWCDFCKGYYNEYHFGDIDEPSR